MQAQGNQASGGSSAYNRSGVEIRHGDEGIFLAYHSHGCDIRRMLRRGGPERGTTGEIVEEECGLHVF